VGAVGIAAALLFTLTLRHEVAASPDLRGAPSPRTVNLKLDQNAAGRALLAQDLGEESSSSSSAGADGAAQEEDKEKPTSMDEQAKPKVTPEAAAAAKQPPKEEDSFAFVKDWPFWVIVGGVIVAAAGGYMIYRNSNTESPCAAVYNQGCFGAR
jgi:hypothetical protein